MAFFPRNYYNTDVSFTPLFQLLNDFDHYSRQGQSGRHTGLAHWQPKFDACETDEAYELHGEIPGMNKEDVQIEFTEPQTMVIRGKTERTYTFGSRPAGLVEGATMHGAITGGEGEHSTSHRATGEVKRSQQTEKAERQPDDKAKYWLSERSVGEFSRSFSFPASVDQNRVSASFSDGILSIIVPKVKKHESRRINIT
ncbi:SHSP domain-containing protein [Fusarium falciforme]|uniref:SHSP domain-containing protein n=1 Tax=Fusarium falciforme TaxID=195108 RepID=UPI00230117A6|nr:SHSP domain-containing protein [Fusarium falciforme]WAO97182.1 SHSP domain-containing protein [Fusarium falciforme]